MLRHQFCDPVDEHTQLGADMPVWRKRDIHRHRIELPVFEQWAQLSALLGPLGHVVRQPEDAHSGQPRGEIGVAVVHRQDVATHHLEGLFFAMHGIGNGLAGTFPQKADDAVMRVLQVTWVGRGASTFQVARRGVDAEPQVADMPRHQR